MMKSRSRWAFAGALLITAVAAGGRAIHGGQVHSEYYGLDQVARSDGFVLQATVVAVHRATGRFSARVKKAWCLPGHEPVGRASVPVPGEKDTYTTVEVRYEQGKEYDFKPYAGIAWSDPRRSPIERRLAGYLSIAELRPGMGVIVAAREVIAASPEALRSVELLFTAKGIGYPGNAKTAQLVKDLRAFELYERAYQELEKRKAVDAAALLSVADIMIPSSQNLFRKHLEQLKAAPEKKRFLKEIARLLAKRPDKEKIKSILYGMAPSAQKSYVPELRQILAFMKVEDDEDREVKVRFEAELDEAEKEKEKE